MDEPPRATVRVSDPGEIAAALPALLGFVPHRSVVLIALGGESGGRVVLTARADLPPGHAPASVVPGLVRAVAAEEPAGALVAVVSEEPDDRYPVPGGPPGEEVTGLPHRPLVHDLVLALTDRDLPVRDALLVRSGRWWSYDCPHPCCAPGAGTPLPAGVSQVEVAAIAAGAVVEPDRAALAARIARVPGPAADACAAAVGRLAAGGTPPGDGWAAVAGALSRYRPGSTAAVPDREAAAAVWALTDLGLRDRALGFALGEDAAAAEALWTDLIRRAPAPFDAAPATLLAVSAWLRGDGALAGLALSRALAARPGYRLAVLLAHGLEACLPPAQLRAVIGDVVGRAG